MKGLKYNMKRLPLSDIMNIVNTAGSRFGFRVMFGSYQGISRTRTIMMSIPSKVLNDRGDLIDGKEMLDKFVENLWKLFDFDHQNCAFKIKEIRNETYQQEPIIKYEPYKYSDYINYINPSQV